MLIISEYMQKLQLVTDLSVKRNKNVMLTKYILILIFSCLIFNNS